MLPGESILCLQTPLTHLQETGELIGFPIDQRLQITPAVKKRIMDPLDMIAEEATLIQSTSHCQKGLTTLCSELPLEPSGEEESQPSCDQKRILLLRSNCCKNKERSCVLG